MKRWIKGIVFTACFFSIVGWGSTYDKKYDRDKGDKQADKTRQGNDEDIKRSQGDDIGRRAIHEQGALQDDERGRW